MGWDEEKVRAYARDNRGLIDRRSAVGFGVSDKVISGQLGRNRWHRLHAGVYHLNATTPDWYALVRAAVIASGTGALASHRTAAVLYGLEGVSGRMIEVTVPYSNRPMPAAVIVHRTRRSLPTAIVASIPVVSIERTVLDLAAQLPEPNLEKALMSAVRLRLTTPDRLAEALAFFGGPGVRGTKKTRRVLGHSFNGITGSPSEVDLMRLIRTAPIPTPECQYQIPLAEGNAYPDFAWPDRMKIVEIDGLDAHSSADRLHNDLARQNMLMQLGWEIRRFSARSVRRAPHQVIAEITSFVNN